MFERVLVANRGAIARRVIRACHVLGIESVAVFSEADADAPYLGEANECVALPGNSAVDTYLNSDVLLAAARSSRCDALHPGYGFLAENADFALAAVSAGVGFIGPDPRWLATMGDKVEARRLAAEHGFPVFGGSGLIADRDQARTVADEIGYPLMIKPSGGGGGIGMRVVRDENELERAFEQARTLARRSFADSGIYLETWLENPRHIEFQLLGDRSGQVAHAFERDCSIQRRHQKVLEETPAPGLDPDDVNAMATRAADFGRELGYDNVGTLETLRTSGGDYGFLEMNTRIQVEHGVTEAVTGLDLVAAQIRLAAGERLPVIPERQGFAIEARVYAEDPTTQLPSTGRLSVFEPPGLHGVRVDTGYQQGQTVTPYYDPLLAKVIGTGTTREMAAGRLLVALKAFAIQGVETNTSLLQGILQDGEFLEGQVDTGFLPRFNQRKEGKSG